MDVYSWHRLPNTGGKGVLGHILTEQCRSLMPELESGLPGIGECRLRRVLAQIGDADALVLASTEYNYSMAPALQNIGD
jgi:hypothetical protein